MVAALEGAWAAIRARHPEVPAAVIVLGAGSIGTAGGLRLGRIAAMRWSQPEHTDAEPVEGEQDLTAPPPSVRLPEVFVGGEGLARGPAPVLGTLLHEAAHAWLTCVGSRTRAGRAAGAFPSLPRSRETA
jgi:hypothetical protein